MRETGSGGRWWTRYAESRRGVGRRSWTLSLMTPTRRNGMPGPPCLHRARLRFAMHVGHNPPFLSRAPFLNFPLVRDMACSR